MTITKVSYGKTYPLGNYSSERIDLEATLHEGEEIKMAVEALKIMCDVMHKENNPHLYQEQDTIQHEYHNVKAPIQQIIQPSEHFIKDYVSVKNVEIPPQLLTQEQKFLQLISLATSTKELSMYEKTANNHKYPQLKAAYDQKYSQLTEK